MTYGLIVKLYGGIKRLKMAFGVLEEMKKNGI